MNTTVSAGQMPELTHRERTIVIIGLMTGLLLAALDQTIVSTALPTIVGEFGGTALSASITTLFAFAAVVTVGAFVISNRMRELPLRDLAAMTAQAPIVEPT